MKRILLVTHYFDDHQGGAEIVAGELARRLTPRGCDILWAASGPTHASVADGLRRLPMTTWNIVENRFGIPYPVWEPLSVLRLIRAVREADAVHIHEGLYLGNAIAYGAARFFRKPVLVTQHIGPFPHPRWWVRLLYRLAERSLARPMLEGCDGCVFCSKKVERYFSQFVAFRRAPSIFWNGVATESFVPVTPEAKLDLRSQLGWPVDRLTMLFVGRFVEKKNLGLMRRLAARFPECDWVFAGWGPDDPSRWGLANVRCLGRRPQQELPRYYQAADLLVLPSVGEGFPLVVQEAMACGTPALISADTAIGMPGIESVAFVSDLAWDKLVSCVQELIEFPQRVRRQKIAATEYARQHWSWERCADQYANLLDEVIGGNHKAWRHDRHSARLRAHITA